MCVSIGLRNGMDYYLSSQDKEDRSENHLFRLAHILARIAAVEEGIGHLDTAGHPYT